MGDGDHTADGASFPLFPQETDGDTENADPKEDVDRHGHRDADLLEELSQLATMYGVEDGCGSDLRSAVLRIGAPFILQLPCDDPDVSRDGCPVCNAIDLRRRNNAVRHHMGSMAQCRGAAGDALREDGAIGALLDVLWRLTVPLQMRMNHDAGYSPLAALLPTTESEPLPDGADAKSFELEGLCDNHLQVGSIDTNFWSTLANEMDTTALDLAISCLGSLRDLSCGSALNRAAVLAWSPPTPERYETKCMENGVHVLSDYVNRYDKIGWEDLLHLKERGSHMTIPAAATTCTDRGKKELRLLTNALGAIRNTSHSTPDVCQEFFSCGLVDLLVWRIMPGDSPEDTQSTTSLPSSSLPEVSRPWREACFRAAGSLINLAEKCPDVAYRLGSNRGLIYLLIETWGGTCAITSDPTTANASTRGLPILHLGLAAILNAAGNGALEGGLDAVMIQVLEKEKIRKRVAQKREEERKRQQSKQKNK